jgi:hypothetical protein
MMIKHPVMEHSMRTTLDIESDVLAAVKEIARQQHTGVGKVMSQLVRRALTGDVSQQTPASPAATSTGFEPFPARGVIVTNELIDCLRDAEGI